MGNAAAAKKGDPDNGKSESLTDCQIGLSP